MDKISKYHEFKQKTDYFWKSIAVYGVLLLLYSLLRGSIENKELTLKLADPFVVLFAAFIVLSLLSLIYREYAGRTILISENEIILKNRLGVKKYTLNDIQSIKISKKRIYNTKSAVRVVKFGFKGRARYIRVRPASYEDPQQLTDELIKIKKRLKR